MKKTRITLPVANWGTLKSKYKPESNQVSNDELTVGSYNFLTNVNGALVKRPTDIVYNPDALTNVGKDQFEAIFNNGTHHLLLMDGGDLKYTSGDTLIHTAASGYTAIASMEYAMFQNRVYFCNGVDSPGVYDLTLNYGSAVALPVTLVVVDYTGLTGDTVTINGVTRTEGVDWTAGTDNDTTAQSLKAALNTISGVVATGSASTLTIIGTSAFIIQGSDLSNLTITANGGPRVKSMGAQAPTTAVTFAADTAGGSVADGGYYYKVTFLYYGFEESNGSPVSALHTVTGGPKTVNLTTIPTGGYGVTARNIYRATAASPDDYRLVGTILDNTTVIFADVESSGTTPIPTYNNVPPTFSYVCLNLSRLWLAGVAGTPSEIYWSVPGQPDVFDPDNHLECNPGDPIQAIYVYQGITVVLNRHSVGQIIGTTDDSFQYQQVPGSVGCVDNRSIQIRTLDGVPTLMWLSDRGIYGFNGSSVFYMSNPIEDEVSLNIQQVNFVTGSRSLSTQSDWQAGTSSPGIDLATDPGVVTTIDPTESFQSQSEWESGELDNIATLDGSNSLKVPTRFAPTLAQGVLSGDAVIDGTNVKLPALPDGSFTVSLAPKLSDSTYHYGLPIALLNRTKWAQKFTVSNAGTVTSLKTWQQNTSNLGGPRTYIVSINSDAFGSPGSPVWSSPSFDVYPTTPPTMNSQTFSPGVVLPAGTYWLVSTLTNSGVSFCFPAVPTSFSNPHVPIDSIKSYIGGVWVTPSVSDLNIQREQPGVGSGPTGITARGIPFNMTFVQTLVSENGSWSSGTPASPYYDSRCSNIGSGMSVVVSGSYPASTNGNLQVFGSTDTYNWDLTDTLSNPNGTLSITGGNYRYWKIVMNLHTDDNRIAPTMGTPSIRFNNSGTWISPVIETTLDGTSFISMPAVNNLPAGTSVVYTIATRTAAGTWAGTGNGEGEFGPLVSAIIRRYAKIKAVLTATSDNASTPSVTSLILNWNLSSTYESAAIDIGQVPAGWGLFQTSAAANGGVLGFVMRSATSAPSLASATYYTVSNGTFPDSAILPLQFTQVKLTLNATPGNLPTVDSITFNWFLGSNAAPIRVASIFVQKTYFLAAAELDAPQNNVVIVYDQDGLWRLFRDININSLSLFFNQPFYCDAIRKYIYQWLTPPTGTSDAITMDVRTKAFDLGLIENLKNVRSCRITGINTGTTIHTYYSVDRGVTWIEMLNVAGTLGYTTTTDGNKFSEDFVPSYTAANVSGTTIMFRVTSTDAYPCEILSIEPTLYVRQGKYLGRPV